MYCNHCGATVAEGNKFCPSCGKPMKNAQRKSIEVKEADIAKNKAAEKERNDKLPAIPRSNKGTRVAIRTLFTVLSAVALVLTVVLVYAYKKELNLSDYSFTASTNGLINLIHNIANKFLSFLTEPREKLSGSSLASYYGASYFCAGGALLAVTTFLLSMFDIAKTKGTAKFLATILFVVNGALSLAIIFIGVKIIRIDIIKIAFEALLTGGGAS